MSHLESFGLIQLAGLTGFERTRLPKKVDVYYYGRHLRLEMPSDTNNKIKIGKVLLTKIGQELAPICGSKPVDGFYEYVKERWKQYLPAVEKD